MKNYLAILSTQEHPAKFLTGRFLCATGLCQFFTIRQNGYQLKFHPANLSCQLWINPLQREEALVFFHDYLKPGDRVVDVGANIGDTVLTASQLVGSSGLVIGFEAHPRTFKFLMENLQLNQVNNVQSFNTAIGEKIGEVSFTNDWRDDMNKVSEGTLKVPVSSLDDLVSIKETIALLKIDVEGYEKFVLEGAIQTLSRTECVYFEIGRDHFDNYGYKIQDVLLLVNNSGFELFKIISNGLIQLIGVDYSSDNVENLIGLRDRERFVGRTSWRIID